MNATARESDFPDCLVENGKEFVSELLVHSNAKRVSFDFPSPFIEKCKPSTTGINASESFDQAEAHDCQKDPNVKSESHDSQFLSGMSADNSRVDAIAETSIPKSVLKRPRYVAMAITPAPLSATGILADEILPTDVIVGDTNVGVLDLPNAGNRRFLAIIHSKIRTFSKLKKKDRLRMAQATSKIVRSAGGRFLSVNTSTGLFHEISLTGAWTNCYITYRDVLQTRQRSASMRRLMQVVQQQELLMCNMKAATSANGHDEIPGSSEQG